LAQFVVMPAMTYLVVVSLDLSAGVAMGMILVASCPGGNISNFISSMAGGNTALSVSLTAIATLAAVVLTPLNFALWGGIYTGRADLPPLEIDAWEMFQSVFILLGIPLLLGMAFNHRFPDLTRRFIRPVKRLSIVIFMGFVVVAFANNFDYFLKYIKYIMLIVLIHNGVALFAGYLTSSVARVYKRDRRTITIETGIQNSGLGLVLIFSLFDGQGGMAFIAAWWGIWHIISGLGVAYLWNKIPVSEDELSYILRLGRPSRASSDKDKEPID